MVTTTKLQRRWLLFIETLHHIIKMRYKGVFVNKIRKTHNLILFPIQHPTKTKTGPAQQHNTAVRKSRTNVDISTTHITQLSPRYEQQHKSYSSWGNRSVPKLNVCIEQNFVEPLERYESFVVKARVATYAYNKVI